MFDEREPAEFKLAADLAAVERQLACLTPAAPRVDRDCLMFEAGRAAEQSKFGEHAEREVIAATQRVAGAARWVWPAATATMTAAALLLATMLVWQRGAALDVGREAKPQAAVALVIDRPGDGATRLAPRPDVSTAGWPTFQRPASGYLGVRYIALTRGVGALEPSFQAASGERGSFNDLPRTQRDMLEELLPSSQRAINPRS